jgi:hypothetical protein
MSLPINAVQSQGVAGTPPSGSLFTQIQQQLAQNLGVSTSDLRSARASGETLAQFAQADGISSSTLNAAVASAIQSVSSARGVTPPTGDQLTATVDRMISHKPHGHHHGGGTNQFPSQDVLSALNQLSPSGSTTGSGSLADLLQSLQASAASSTSGGSGDPSTDPTDALLGVNGLLAASGATATTAVSTPDRSGSGAGALRQLFSSLENGSQGSSTDPLTQLLQTLTADQSSYSAAATASDQAITGSVGLDALA